MATPLNNTEYQTIIYDWNKTDAPYPKDKTIHQLFEAQVKKTPNNTALVFENQSLTYNELNIRANQLAHHLRDEYKKTHTKTLKPDTLIAICLDRSLEMVIAILAVLKAGAAYVPIDPDYPIERIQFQLDDTQAAFLLTNSTTPPSHGLSAGSTGGASGEKGSRGSGASREKSCGSVIIYLDELPQQHAPKTNPKPIAKPTDLAYVIYTSGTTGKPKGVMVTHANWGYVISAMSKSLSVKPGSRYAQVVSFTFDMSCLDLGLSLTQGLSLHILPRAIYQDPKALIAHLADNTINIADLPTALYHQCSIKAMSDLKELSYLIVAGEKLRQPSDGKKQSYTLINGYGPTEATALASFIACSPGKHIKAEESIGRPLLNAKLYILDTNRVPVPLGAIGELYIGGAGVARGYLNRPDLTEARFIENPFATQEDKQKGYNRLYKTGDLVRYRDDGNIEYMGRNDFQVKIRGFRIELGEIETQLLTHPSVQQAAVIPYQHDETASTQLVAYYVGTETIDNERLRTHLADSLPDYMIPAAFMSLPGFPLTINGKLDRKALPNPDFTGKIESYVAPRSTIEKSLSDIWQQVLGLDRVGIQDDFFRLGGDSIHCIQVISNLQREGVSCTVSDIFDCRTIAALSLRCETVAKTSAEQGRLTGSFGLLPIQDWFFKQPFPNPNHWHQAFMLRAPTLSPKKINNILVKLVNQHDILRIQFKKTKQGYQQVYQRNINIPSVSHLDISKTGSAGFENALNDWVLSLDIQKGPLWQVATVTGYPDKQPRLLFILHHLIIDSVSWRIIAEDLKRLHQGETLGKKSNSYREWVKAIADYPNTHPEEAAFWEAINHKLPSDKSYPTLTKRWFSADARLSKKTSKQLLHDVHQAYHTQINDILLTALAYALHDSFGGKHHGITLEGHGREPIDGHTEVSRTVGWFTSQFPVCLEVQRTVAGSIQHIKETLHRIPNKGVGYGPAKMRSPNAFKPLPSITFNYLGQFDTSSKLWQLGDDLSITQADARIDIPQLLNVNGWLKQGELTFHMESYTSQNKINHLAKAFELHLQKIIKHCLTQKASRYTPCDFELVQVSQCLLDTLQAKDSNIETIYPANSLQRGFIYHTLSQPNDEAYRVQYLWDYDTPINIEDYKQAWAITIETYPALRTYFNWDEAPIQISTEKGLLRFTRHDIRNTRNQDKAIREIQLDDRTQPFDLRSPTLFRIHLIQCSESKYTLIVTVHHIIIDGWSVPLLLDVVHRCYTNLNHGYRPTAEKDLAYLQTQTHINRHKATCQAYWEKQCATIETINDLSSLCSRRCDLNQIRSVSKPRTIQRRIKGRTYQALKTLALNEGITLHTILQFAWHKLIQVYTQDNTTIVGTTLSGRTLPIPDIEKSIGLYINTLPLVVNWSPKTTREQLRLIEKTVVEANEHAYADLASLQSEGHRLFHSILVFENYPTTSIKDSNITAQLREIIEHVDYPINLMVKHDCDHLSTQLHYDATLLHEKDAKKLMERFELIITQLPSAIEKPHHDITLLSQAEYQTIVYDWNKTDSPYPKGKTIHQRFEEQVKKTPLATALVFEDQSLTYQELNDRANQLAHYLRDEYKKNHGEALKPDTLIAICLERSQEMLIAILGVLKADAAYVPVDPDYPIERIQFQLEDTQAAFLLTNRRSGHNLDKLVQPSRARKQAGSSSPTPPGLTGGSSTTFEPGHWPPRSSRGASEEESCGSVIIYLDELPQQHAPKTNPKPCAKPSDLAYVIYTSGTTGKPKGVMIEHTNVVHYQSNISTYLKHVRRIDCSSNLAFDLTVTTTLVPLMSGMTIYIYSGSLKDTKHYAEHLASSKVECIKSTPSYLAVLAQFMAPLAIKCCIVGGEKLNKNTLRKISSFVNALYDEYGPTETTVGASIIQKNDASLIADSIGRPYLNCKCYILGRGLTPLPLGAVGELYIGGAGVARGYLNRPDLTEARFIENPFATQEDKQKGYTRLYKTGDLVRYRDDGNIEYIGRNDFQVKIRGFRIELGEIETQLLTHPDVEQAAVIPYQHDETASTQLVAYYVGTETIDNEHLRTHLADSLPDYMIPAAFMALPEFPLTVNGKLDRRALPKPTFESDENTYVPPQNDIQKSMCNVWEKVLGVKRVGIQDDFFRLGGDSILSIQAASQLQQAGLRCRLKDIFECRTILALSKRYDSITHVNAEQGLLEGTFNLHPIQSWFFERHYPNKHHWNQAFIVKVPTLTLDALRAHIHALALQHDSLRTRFKKTKSSYVQIYDKHVTIPKIKRLDISGLTESELDAILSDWQSDFNILNGPLWRVAYLTGYPDNHPRLWLALHHLIIDAVSWRILVQDLKRLHAGEYLGEKTTSYRQWVNRIESYPETHPDELAYWEAVNSKRSALSTNYPKLNKNAYYANTSLNKQQTKSLLKNVNQAYHTEINDILLTAITYTLKDLFSGSTHAITLEGHGREDIAENIDTSQTVGWFTSMFPVCLEVENTLEKSIQSIKETLHSIPNKGVGYGAFKQAQISHFPDYPPITFNYLGQFSNNSTDVWQITNDKTGTQVPESNSHPHLIEINGLVMDEQLSFEISSHTSEAITNKIAKVFKAQLTKLIQHCLSQDISKYTPCDFKIVQLTQSLLDNLQNTDPNIEAIYPATSLQRGFIYHALAHPDDDAYRVQVLWDYETNLNVDTYKKAWALAIETYPILRTYFNWEEDILQIITREGMLRFTQHDIQKEKNKNNAIREIQEKDRLEPFDLQSPTLLRLHLIHRGHNQYTLLKTEHHSISDGWSGPILLNKVHQYYKTLIQHQTPQIEKDTAYHQAQINIASQKEKLHDYWNKQTSLISNVNDLKVFCAKPCNLSTLRTIRNAGSRTLDIKGKPFQALKTLSQTAGVTMHSILQFAWHKLIQVYTQDETTVVGTTLSGRTLPIAGIENSVGLYINTLPLIVPWNTKTIREQLTLIEQTVIDANEHAAMDLASLQNKGERLFQSLLIYENYPDASDDVNTLQLGFRETIEKIDYPFGLTVAEQTTQLALQLQYDATLLSSQKASLLLKHLSNILASLPRLIDKPHHEISLLSKKDYQTIIYDWNKTDTPYPKDKTIHQLFEAQVNKTPNNTALVFENQSLTYNELNIRANQLAHHLRDEYKKTHTETLKPDTLIAICLDRSLEMVIAILAVLKAGAAYVPIDPDYPIERIQFQLDDTQAAFLLTNSTTPPRSSRGASGEKGSRGSGASGEESCGSVIIYLDELPQQHAPKTNPKPVAKPTDLAYVIYTSGTTGKPKGVMVTHQNWMNVTYAAKLTYSDLAENEKIAQIASFIFDTSCLDITISLLNGYTLHVLNEEKRLDISELFAYLKASQITYMHVPTILYQQMDVTRLRSLTTLKYLMIGGEPLTTVHDSHDLHYKFLNTYGPTETTVESSLVACSPGNTHVALTTIGKPISNTKLYILDTNRAPVPLGAVGELYIGGAGVARGYLNRPDLTEARFIENPFATQEDKQKGYTRLYKTGDLVRYRDDGNIEYIGRNDFQVKIRGFRIELGEIETQLLTHPGVEQAAVIPYQHDETTSTQLVAYYVGTETIDNEHLRTHLADSLPDYMIPAAFMALPKFPLTVNGKLDRRALPEPTFESDENTYVPPQNDIQKSMCNVWEKVLGVKRVGIQDDFFRLGGHSILAITAAHQLSLTLNRKIAVADVFAHKTIQAILKNTSPNTPRETIKPTRLKKTPLSFGQERFWILEAQGAGHAYTIPIAYALSEHADETKLNAALQALCERHNILRTVYVEENGNLYQKVVSQTLDIPIYSTTDKSLSKKTYAFLETPFDLSQDLPLKVALFKTPKQRLLVFNIHHIAFDEWSDDVFINELIQLYQGKSLPKLPIQYKDFAVWQRKKITENQAESLNYWTTQLADYEHLHLPLDKPRPKSFDFKGDSVPFCLGKDLSERLRLASKQLGVTLYSLMLSAFYLLLARLSNQSNIIIGTPIANRDAPELEHLIGYFLNTLALRFDVNETQSGKSMALAVHKMMQAAQTHQHLPFETILNTLKVERQDAYHPLFQVMFVLTETQAIQTNHHDLFAKSDRLPNTQTAKFDLTFSLHDDGHDISAGIEYATSLFEQKTIQRFAQYYQRIINAFVEHLDKPILDYQLLSDKERQTIIYDWNKTDTPYPKDKTIHQLFEAQVNKTPNNTALVFENQSLTYNELNIRANQLAHHLRDEYKKTHTKTLKPDTLIAICLDRSLEMVIAILAVLKAGAAYVPIDPDYPSERIQFQLDDTQAAFLLTNSTTPPSHGLSAGSTGGASGEKGRRGSGASGEESCGSVIIYLDELPQQHAPKTNPKPVAKPTDLAYVIYTSGTTGKPKGIMVEQQGIISLVKNTNYIQFKKTDTVAFASSASFDAATLEIWGALLNGACLSIISREKLLDSKLIQQALGQDSITVLWLTAELFKQHALKAPEMFKSLRVLLAGGDVLDYEAVKSVVLCSKGSPKQCLNGYGPTEGTTFTTTQQLEQHLILQHASTLPIGKPISNKKTYILNQHLQPLPLGAIGELYIGGAGVARGYLNRPDLTEARFIENPFATQEDKQKGYTRLYKTGDLVRYRDDGNIEYIGRNDFQVKIRGFRIELGEIETQLLTHPGVEQAAVIPYQHDETTSTQLVAYYVGTETIDNEDLRTHLADSLPDYMIPAAFMALPKFPLTVNAKLDRRALPKPTFESDENTYVPPQNDIQKSMCNVWEKVLGVKRVGIQDDFFRLGGHSILAITAAHQLSLTLDRKIAVADIFAHKTIQAILKNTSPNTPRETIKPTRLKKTPLSFGQERFWILEAQGAGHAYTIPIAYALSEDTDETKLNAALQALCERHNILRTVYVEENGNLYQKVVSQTLDIPIYSTTDKSLSKKTYAFLETPFDLSQDLPLKVALFKTPKQRLLVFNIHHIAFDEWSDDVFINELIQLYQGKSLPKLPIQYKDFAVWQRKKITENQAESLNYWTTQLADYEHLHLPLDKPRPKSFDFKGDSVPFRLGKDLSERLRLASKQLGVTLYSLMLSAFYLLLSRLSNQSNIIIGTPIANRDAPELEHLIGYFLNTLALRFDVNETQSGKSMALAVHKMMQAAQTHQHLPFETILNTLKVERQDAYHPLFQVMFVLTETQATQTNHHDLFAKSDRLPNTQTAKFDLTFSLHDDGHDISAGIEYATSLFEQKTIQRFAQYYQRIINAFVEHLDKPILDYQLLSDKERQTIIYDWNKTDTPYPKDKTIHQLFEAQVNKTPNNTALVFENQSLTYNELNMRANQLAHHLRDEYKKTHTETLKPDTLIAICLDRSLEMVIAILAVLKAGAAYVPIDPDYPIERIQFQLDDTQAAFLLTNRSLRHNLGKLVQPSRGASGEKGSRGSGASREKSCDSVIIYLDDLPQQHAPKTNPKPCAKPTDLAYVIYTSGTTGKPKGVMVNHANWGYVVSAMSKSLSVKPGSRYAQVVSFTFDMSCLDLGLSLTQGLSLHILPRAIYQDPKALIAHLADNTINIADLPTALYQQCTPETLTQLKTLQHLIVAGEKLQQSNHGSDLSFSLINGYGPTEATALASLITSLPGKHNTAGETIGRPLLNAKLYILDTNRSPVPLGAIGELYIGGAGVARGYLNRPDLTEARFIENPFATQEDKQKGYTRLYKTGDLVRYRDDGNIEYMGRNDFQVKIRGFRIELGEIETQLLTHPAVKQAAVLPYQREGDDSSPTQLVAYTVATETLDNVHLREHLSNLLPDYMIPAAFMALPKFPLTVNGKLDRRALPKPTFESDENTYVPPQNDIQKSMCNVWEKVLGVKRVGIQDDFFRLGGHSILAITAAHQLSLTLNRKIAVADVFAHKTIQAILKNTSPNTPRETIKPTRLKKTPLSFGQERFWILEAQGAGHAYTIPIAYALSEDTDETKLNAALQALSERHEILRTIYLQDNGKLYQKRTKTPLEIESNKTTDKTLGSTIKTFLQRPFDLSQDLPLKVALFKTPKQRLLVFNIHHIAFDEWSDDVFINELIQLYQGKSLPKLPIQYKDFAVWQRKKITENQAESLNYWTTQLADYEHLHLPLDKPRPKSFDFKGDSVPFCLGKDLSERLRLASKQLGVTLYSLMLSAFYLLLSRLSNQSNIIIGTPIANRDAPELEHLIGYFLNTLALRFDVNETQSGKSMALAVHKMMQAAQTHQHLPFETILNTLKVERQDAYHPLFQVMFVLTETQATQTNHHDLFAKSDRLPNTQTAKFDLTLSLHDDGHDISAGIEYATSLFEQKTIQRFAQYYQRIINAFVEHLDKPILDYQLLSDKERQTIIYDWNKTDTPYPKDKTIHQLFEAQVKKTPNNTALVFENQSLTYNELNMRANQLAHHLRDEYKKTHTETLKPDTLIAICLDRSLEMVIAILAVLKAGAAYVPIDPDYPSERIQFQLDDTQAAFLLTNSTTPPSHGLSAGSTRGASGEKGSRGSGASREESCGSVIIYLDDLPQQHAPKTNPKHYAKPTDLAYVIYTSGTTGKPKGVMVNHANWGYVISAMSKSLSVKPGSRYAQVVSFTFDMSCLDLGLSLTQGLSLHILPRAIYQDPKALIAHLADNTINIADLPTALYQQCTPETLTQLKTLQHLIVAGEKLQQSNHGSDLSFSLINGYGPTEATALASLITSPPGKHNTAGETIGRPLLNAKLYILDTNRAPVPLGAVGELYIGGAGVARGYLNRPDLTEARFIENPFATQEDKQKGYTRLYKTGDLVRYRDDGNIEYMGRNDFQVKIRGFRIELGEIETQLLTHPSVQQAAVLPYQREGDDSSPTQLVAYTVATETLDNVHLREHLSNLLPDYMIPAAFMALPEFPLTVNGKLDRRALPKPTFESDENTYVPPQNDIQKSMCNVWEKVLGVKRVGIQDDFFKLGGNSILALQLVHKMAQDNLHFSIIDILKEKNIKNLLKIHHKHPLITPFNVTDNALPNLFLIPTILSGSEVYINLAETFKAHFSCIGIENYNLVFDDTTDNLTSLAENYLAAIQENYPINQPLYLAGWCLGGKIAMEMAYLLEQKGHENINILLLDTFAFDENTLPPETTDIETKRKNREKTFQAYCKDHQDEDPCLLEKIFTQESHVRDKLSKTSVSGQLFKTKAILVKAMIPDVVDCEIARHHIQLPDNHVLTYIKNHLSVVGIEADHFKLITQGSELLKLVLPELNL